MAVTYATVTRAATGPTPKRTFAFHPMTDDEVVTIAAENYEHVGPYEVTTGAGGTFSIDIPLGTDQGGADLVWKIVETPVDRIAGRGKGGLAPAVIGYATITASIGYDDLIAGLIDVTVVDPGLEASVAANAVTASTKAAEASGYADAALDSAANADSSADLAAASESNAASSASTASTAATTATTKASEASTSATAAAASATHAEDMAGAAEAVAVSNDTIIAGRINDSASATSGALSATFVSGVSATQDAMRRLDHDEDLRIAILTDSTGDASNEWPRLLGDRLADDWATHDVSWTPPADDTYAPGTPVSIQTGTGAGAIDIRSMAIAGSQSYNWQSADFLAELIDFDPHLILVASGHNDGEFTGDPQTLGQPREAFRLRYQLVLEEFRRLLPHAQMVLIAQHPWSDHPAGDMDQKRDELRLLAQLGGHGFVDMYQAWTDVGSATTAGWYNVGDNVHINATGEAFYADTIHSIFTVDPKWEPRPQRASLLDLATPLNLADDMVMPSGATGPIGWNLDNVTATRDTSNFESSRGYAIKLVPVSGAASSRIYKQIASATTVLPLRGRWVTILGRMRRPAAGGVDNRNVGRMSVSDGVLTSKTFNDDKGYGGFMWRAIPHYVDEAATSLTVSLWCDWGPSGGAVNPDVTWDRFMVIPGLTPFGWAGRSGVAALRNAEKFESLTLGDSTMPTSPSLALDAVAGVARDIYVKTAGVNRWIVRGSSESETGSDAGTNLQFLARTDAGAAVGSALILNRRRLNATFGSWVNCASYATASRPSTSVVSEGSQIWDSTLHKPVWYDGTAYTVGATTLSATATLDFPSVAAGGSQELTITVTGAVVGDSVQLGAPAAVEAGLVWNGYVSATNTVKVRLSNVTGSAIDPASATWKAAVVR